MAKDVQVVPNHYFRVQIENVTQEGSLESFVSIEGLKLLTETRSYLPGGYSTPFEIPVAKRTTDLVLVRYTSDNKETDITKWCLDVVYDDKKIQPTLLHIFLLHSDKSVAAQWSAGGVYPKGIEVFPIGLEIEPISKETITLGCSSITRKK